VYLVRVGNVVPIGVQRLLDGRDAGLASLAQAVVGLLSLKEAVVDLHARVSDRGQFLDRGDRSWHAQDDA
jgi:hypothetical protein